MASSPHWRIGHILDLLLVRKNFETYEVQVQWGPVFKKFQDCVMKERLRLFTRILNWSEETQLKMGNSMKN